MKKYNLSLLVLLFCLGSGLGASLVFAIPVPHGIDGIIYDLNTNLPVSSEVNFSVNNTLTGEYITGTTRNNGHYSVSLNKALDGDTIIVSAKYINKASNKTLTLSGVMHNVALYLDMYLKNSPPTINSIPVAQATLKTKYAYSVNASDPDNDTLRYVLLIKPKGMHIQKNTGQIEWLPNKNQLGNNSVKLQLTDNNYNITQEFTILVSETIEAILSSREQQRNESRNNITLYNNSTTSSSKNKIITTGPKDMRIISGIIFQPNGNQISEDTKLMIKTENQTIEIQTGAGDNSGSYHAIIQAKRNQNISIEVKKEEDSKSTTLVLNEDRLNLNLVYDKKGLKVIDYNLKEKIDYNKSLYGIILLLILIIISYLTLSSKIKSRIRYE